MRFRLREGLLPLVLELRMDGTLQGGLIHLDAAQFRFQRLIQQFALSSVGYHR
jgi:hypothetical protein